MPLPASQPALLPASDFDPLATAAADACRHHMCAGAEKDKFIELFYDKYISQVSTHFSSFFAAALLAPPLRKLLLLLLLLLLREHSLIHIQQCCQGASGECVAPDH